MRSFDQQRLGVNFRGKRRREPPQFGGIFRQISGGARHAYGYHNIGWRIRESAEFQRKLGRSGLRQPFCPNRIPSISSATWAAISWSDAPHERGPTNLTFLKTLGEKTQAGAVPGQNLHVVAALAAKTNAAPSNRIGAHNCPAPHRLGQPSLVPRRMSTGFPSRQTLHARRRSGASSIAQRRMARDGASLGVDLSPSDILAPIFRLISFPAPCASARLTSRLRRDI